MPFAYTTIRISGYLSPSLKEIQLPNTAPGKEVSEADCEWLHLCQGVVITGWDPPETDTPPKDDPPAAEAEETGGETQGDSPSDTPPPPAHTQPKVEGSKKNVHANRAGK